MESSLSSGRGAKPFAAHRNSRRATVYFFIMSPTDILQNYHGLILAAGTSSRMGSPKALLPIGDSYFLHQIYKTFLTAGVRPVLIVINRGDRKSTRLNS